MSAADRDRQRAARLGLSSALLGRRTTVRPPDPFAPFWREEDGTRHSYGSLRCGLDDAMASELGQAHLEAIGQIARAALAAFERGDRRETARLAVAAGRLCEEIAGRWPPAAVAVPKR
ncbi:MAG: hypothetical protein ICV69_10750 [Thermoleophilaceae bacterium]|nr:hypothetical protein [Thermoleophilaceae bacterium]